MSMTATELCVELKDKSAIAQAFGKAAAHYDQHAAFQRDVGLRLLQKMPSCLKGLRVLDLGCGTGYFSACCASGERKWCAPISHSPCLSKQSNAAVMKA